MPLTDLTTADLIGTGLAFLLTLMTLSYFLGDNPLFRLAAHLFVGAAAGYAGAVAWTGVLQPRLLAPVRSFAAALSGEVAGDWLLLIPLLLTLLLLFKLSARTARFGNPVMAFLVGVGAAVAVGGAVIGTLFPQAQAALFSFKVPEGVPPDEVGEHLFDGTVALLGTVATLVYFHFGARRDPGNPPARPALVAPLAYVGQVFIAITFGAMYAGVMAASIAILSDRLQFLWDFLRQIALAAGVSG